MTAPLTYATFSFDGPHLALESTHLDPEVAEKARAKLSHNSGVRYETYALVPIDQAQELERLREANETLGREVQQLRDRESWTARTESERAKLDEARRREKALEAVRQLLRAPYAEPNLPVVHRIIERLVAGTAPAEAADWSDLGAAVIELRQAKLEAMTDAEGICEVLGIVAGASAADRQQWLDEASEDLRRLWHQPPPAAPTFYLTFGQQYRYEAHPHWDGADPHGWVSIHGAADINAARRAVVALLGTNWCDVYSAEPLPRWFPRGEIGRIVIEDTGPRIENVGTKQEESADE